MRGLRISSALLISTFLLQSVALLAQPQPENAAPRRRITRTINDQDRVTLLGNRHPLARPENETGLYQADYRMERMILTLNPDADQEKALDELVADQYNPKSPRYHQWLTPETFGRQFGVSQEDLDLITDWLRSQGFDVEEIPSGRRAILFSGSASQVETAFRVPIRTYSVNGETHHANAADPEIPVALAGVVQGVVSLHDFRSYPVHTHLRTITTPQFTNGSSHFMAPADFASIYHLGPLYQNSIDGTGQTIAIVGRTNINLTDVQNFRSYFGLPSNNPIVIVSGADPGIVSSDEEGEAILDVEWSGAIAKKATVKFVVAGSTSSSDGVTLSAQYIVNHNLAPVMSVSFGLCEAAAGTAGNNFINNLWQQAAAQGITVFVSSGDSGAAGCDGSSASTATHGHGVNALCSPLYSVCVGGTQLNDTSSPSSYWSATSDPTTKGSALQYIPEVVWNESGLATGGSGLWAGGGGVSTLYSKPSWQNVMGVPADGRRDVPDVSLAAAGHDGYLIYMSGQLAAESGTSAASPSFAGLMALVVQKTGAAQGNANPTLYRLAGNQLSGGAAVFHDVTTGNNAVPGVTGFNAGPGYDLATGLGSVDAATLINHWTDGSAASSPLRIDLQTPALRVVQGTGSNVRVTVGTSDSFDADITLSVSNLPGGVTATFSPRSFSAPGSGVSVLNLNVSANAVPGIYNVQISATGGGFSQQATLSVIVDVRADFGLVLSQASVTARRGGTATVKASVTLTGGFSSGVTFSASGLPRGMTAKFAPSSFPAPGNGNSTLTLSVGLLVPPGDYNIQVSGSGADIVHSAILRVTVKVLPSLN
jgi:pseudomonalisin